MFSAAVVSWAKRRLAAGDLGQAVDLRLDLPGEGVHVQAHVGQKPGDQALPLAQEREVQMFAVQLLLAVLNGDGLAVRNGLLGVLGVLIEIHGLASFGLRVPGSGFPKPLFLFVP